MNGAVFKTVSETVRTGSGRFDSYTPPPDNQWTVGSNAVASKNASNRELEIVCVIGLPST